MRGCAALRGREQGADNFREEIAGSVKSEPDWPPCRSGTGDGGADGCEPHWPRANSHQACELESTKASAV